LIAGYLVMLPILRLKLFVHYKKIADPIILFAMSFWLEAWYIYFHLNCPPSDQKIYLIAHMMVITFQTFYIYRFRTTQIAFNVIGSVSLMTIAFLNQEWLIDMLLLSVGHGVSAGIAFFMRREFINSLFQKYKNLMVFLPKK